MSEIRDAPLSSLLRSRGTKTEIIELIRVLVLTQELFYEITVVPLVVRALSFTQTLNLETYISIFNTKHATGVNALNTRR